MANKITDMSKIRKVIKFYSEGKSKLFISNYLSLSRNTVKKYLSLFEVLGLNQEMINEKTDAELELLFSHNTVQPVSTKLQSLHNFFPGMERELKKVGITIQHMWEEYIILYPDGFQRSQFRHHYKEWSKRVNPVMHMNHKSGDKMYVDYAGKTLSIVDRDSGELNEVQFFVAILGASQYTYAEASMSQQKEDFVKSVENAIRFFEGTPAAIVPDNLKSAVIKSSRFEPTINETLADLADHYETTILPARAYKPRDKSLVEGAVKILYRRIYANLKQKFYSLEELNQEILILLDYHNKRKLTARPYSRYDLFLEDEKEKLRPLPQDYFKIRYQSFATVMQNGHVQLSKDKNYYSVPYQYIKKKVKILYTSSTVEIYHKYNRIAMHKRNYKPYVYSTINEHLASTHQFVSGWNADKFIEWAGRIDDAVSEYILQIIESRNHPEQAYKSCLGILNFEKKVGRERLINACKRALDFKIYSFKTVQKILENNLDQIDFPQEKEEDQKLPEHGNIRGKQYYN
ncbi:IS21 family transposase [Chryseobacterium gwangjuense]|uniref:IS21 family transposase n=1 Tax=Chryseobacterium gwangjuense TaxID=1069980 RepID=UPI001E3113E4|nr:IS21 family transposase [Chryseobacterium gwangjuense]MCE3077298.1 IS21 family transposase [Chryseobacterium gwangjuense]